MADKYKKNLIVLAFVLFSVMVVGLFSFITDPSQTVGFGLSYVSGLSMIFLPCTLPLALLIVPIALKKSVKKGITLALLFGAGLMITFSIYGVVFSYIGSVIGLLTANIIAGIVGGLMAYLFGMSELGVIKMKVPGYSGPLPGFVHTIKSEYFKIFIFGMILANVGLGCPNPAFYVLLAYVISSTDVFTGWAIMAVHGIGRATPLIFMAVLAMIGVNALSSVESRSASIRKWTAWGLIIVGIILFTTTGMFREWFEHSPVHTFWNDVVFYLTNGAVTEDERLHTEESSIISSVPQHLAPYAMLLMLSIPILLYYFGKDSKMRAGSKKVAVILIAVLVSLGAAYAIVSNMPSEDDHHMGEENVVPHSHDEDDHMDEMMMEVVFSDIDRSVSGIDSAGKSQMVELSDGDTFQLDARPVSKDILGDRVRMLGYNGQIPGPLLKVEQGSTVYLNFTNNMEFETTVHSHGLRLDNKFDGVPEVTQDSVETGGSFLYELTFPDDGMYWYHPHVREDLQQELGLYGNILVVPSTDSYNEVDSEVALFLDDISMFGSDVETLNSEISTHSLMGRFGNLMLVNGETDYEMSVGRGDVVRFYLTDSANTRTFNFSIEGHEMKLVGGDSGRYEMEEIVDSVVISPSERYIVEVLFEEEGEFNIQHRTPSSLYILGSVNVVEGKEPDTSFFSLNENEEVVRDIDRVRDRFDDEPDLEIELTVDIGGMGTMGGMDHMEHGMESGMMMEHSETGIEWEDDMGMMNILSTDKDTRWIMRDASTGRENMDIDYTAKVGDVKKIRLFNDPDSAHPMQHPIHLHGQRFLVISEDGVPNDNLVWKDTALVTTGKTVDILVEFTNPGEWMAHCHIAEHLSSGMMMSIDVI